MNPMGNTFDASTGYAEANGANNSTRKLSGSYNHEGYFSLMAILAIITIYSSEASVAYDYRPRCCRLAS